VEVQHLQPTGFGTMRACYTWGCCISSHFMRRFFLEKKEWHVLCLGDKVSQEKSAERLVARHLSLCTRLPVGR